MNRPLLYDVFSGAGGAGRGYQDAGFYVVGIDSKPQPRYAGDDFIQMDAFDFFDAVERGEYPEPDLWHASPPCQRYSATRTIWKRDHPDLVPPTRERLATSGQPFVIENVIGSPLVDPILLCGTMFGLKVYRHRLFETTFDLLGISHAPHRDTLHGNHSISPKGFIGVFGGGGFTEYKRAAMQIDWMTRDELSQAIPPAYTRFIGEQAIRILQAERSSAA